MKLLADCRFALVNNIRRSKVGLWTNWRITKSSRNFAQSVRQETFQQHRCFATRLWLKQDAGRSLRRALQICTSRTLKQLLLPKYFRACLAISSKEYILCKRKVWGSKKKILKICKGSSSIKKEITDELKLIRTEVSLLNARFAVCSKECHLCTRNVRASKTDM